MNNQWKVVLWQQAPYISEFLFLIVTRLSRSFLRIVKPSSIHMLQFDLVNIFIVSIGFICFTTLNVTHLRRSVRDVVAIECSPKWAANESDFCLFLSSCRRSDKWLSTLFFLIILSAIYINSVTHGAFYFLHFTLRTAFTSVEKISVEFWWKRTVTYSIHQSLENTPCPIFAAMSLLSNSAKLLSLL